MPLTVTPLEIAKRLYRNKQRHIKGTLLESLQVQPCSKYSDPGFATNHVNLTTWNIAGSSAFRNDYMNRDMPVYVKIPEPVYPVIYSSPPEIYVQPTPSRAYALNAFKHFRLCYLFVGTP